jgi:hypothetical protein
MLTKPNLLTIGLSVLAVILMASYFMGRTDSLEEALVAERASNAVRADSLRHYARIGVGDSLVREGNYRQAIDVYEDLEADTSFTYAGEILDDRIEHARRLVQVGARLDTLRRMSARRLLPTAPSLAPIQPTTVARMDMEATNPNQYDSLRFALKKADMQIRNLKGQLRNTSGGNYLTFKSRQGNDVYYVGDVRNGKANGRGVALLSSGSRYQGEWADNRKHGVGEFNWPDGARYEGQYEDDQRSGQGTYHFPDGSVFVGDWENDLRNGEGIFYNKRGDVVARGVWRDDELVEQGK